RRVQLFLRMILEGTWRPVHEVWSQTTHDFDLRGACDEGVPDDTGQAEVRADLVRRGGSNAEQLLPGEHLGSDLRDDAARRVAVYRELGSSLSEIRPLPTSFNC